MRWQPLGDAGLLLHLGDAIEEPLNARVHVLAARIRAAAVPGVADVVPGYASVAAVFAADADPGPAVEGLLALDLEAEGGAPAPPPPRTVVLPVCYGGADGPDLPAVAAHAGLSAEEAVARHTAATYVVGLLGFQPGFPYLIGLHPALALPRRASPRTRVPAGSVAIGGAQTGVYPRESPGGWHLVGRTGAVLFDPRRDPPTLLLPGDRVRFRRVSREVAAEAAVEVEP